MNQNNPPKKKKLSAGSEVLMGLFENGKSPLSGQFLRWKLWAKWPEVVGTTIAQNAEPVAFKNGILFLWVRHSAWMQQLVFMREHIQTTINQKMGQPYVKSIRFTLDRREVPQQDDMNFKEMIEKLVPEGSEND